MEGGGRVGEVPAADLTPRGRRGEDVRAVRYLISSPGGGAHQL